MTSFFEKVYRYCF